MNIISGVARGKKLETLEGEHTRPTLTRIKESIFNIVQFDIIDKNILDLFAGSGQIGLEALSRGAGHCVFADNTSSNIIEKNIKNCGFIDNYIVKSMDYKLALKEIKSVDIIFLDPPYNEPMLNDALELISELDILSKNGIIICETNLDYEFKIPNNMHVQKTYKYGKILISKILLRTNI